jgi:hypothetical protein
MAMPASMASSSMSRMQIDDPARSFSFRNDRPLDMRMGAEADRRRCRQRNGAARAGSA